MAVGTPAALPVTPAVASTPGAAGIARPDSQPPPRLATTTPAQPPQQSASQPSGITPAGVGTPRSVTTPAPSSITTQARHTPIPTPAPTPGGQTASTVDVRRGLKREREDSVPLLNGTAVGTQSETPGMTVSTNGPARTGGVVMNAKAGSGGVRPRPLKKQRMVR